MTWWDGQGWCLTRVERIVSMCEYSAQNGLLLILNYRAIPCGNAPNCSFLVQLKPKDHGITSTLCKSKPLAPRLQCPGSRFTTNQPTPSSFFLTFNHRRCGKLKGTICEACGPCPSIWSTLKPWIYCQLLCLRVALVPRYGDITIFVLTMTTQSIVIPCCACVHGVMIIYILLAYLDM